VSLCQVCAEEHNRRQRKPQLTLAVSLAVTVVPNIILWTWIATRPWFCPAAAPGGSLSDALHGRRKRGASSQL